MAASNYNEAWARLQGGGGMGVGSAAERYILTESMWVDTANFEGKKARNLKLPRGKGIDTIFLLDISESMKGEKFVTAKNIVNEIIQDIKGVYKRYGLHENVALVTIGHETKVVHHLTSDYDAVSESLERITTGGKTPIMAGMYMSLSAIVGRGSVTVMNGYHAHPRIIMLTDGKATDSASITGSDSSLYSEDEIIEEVINVAMRLGCENHQIYCVPIGDSPNMVLLEQIASLTKGKIVKSDEVHRLARHFKNLAAITRLKRKCEIDQSSFAGILRASESDLLESDIEDIFEILVKTDNLRDVSPLEEETYYHDLPQLGARVERGPHWKYGNDDSGKCGTIVQHIKGKPGWVKVEWDANRIRHNYRFGAEDCFDVAVTNQPRILTGDELIAPGCLVTRGSDWSYGIQDGGAGNIGVVYNVRDKTMVQVRWPNGHKNHYQFGTNGMFDVQIWLPKDGSQDQVPVPLPPISRKFQSPDVEESQDPVVKDNGDNQCETDGTREFEKLYAQDPVVKDNGDNQWETDGTREFEKLYYSQGPPDLPSELKKESESKLVVSGDRLPKTSEDLYLHTKVQWSWFDSKVNKFVNFPEDQNFKAEENFKKKMKDERKKGKTVMVTIDGTSYRVNFTSMTMCKINTKEVTKVQRVDAPLPILGMTKEKINQYFEAVLHGSRPARNIRLMLVGHERVGKTSICRNLLKDRKAQAENKIYNVDKSFKGNTEGTEGIDIYIHSFEINMKTKERKRLDQTDQEIAEKKLANYMMEHQKNKSFSDAFDDDDDGDDGDNEDVDSEAATSKIPDHKLPAEHEFTQISYPHEIMKKEKKHFSASKQKGNVDRTIPNNVVEDVKNIILKSVEADVENEIAFLSMWDFGGEDSFYDSHHIFLSSDAIYLVVFNVEECLNNEERHERVRFWLRSIASYWNIMDEEDESQPQPPIIMVGTHIDKIPGTKEEKHSKFLNVCYAILDHEDVEKLKSKIVNYCCVDNESESEESEQLFENLWEEILENTKYQSQWNKSVPIKWFTLERELMKQKSAGKKILTLKDIIDLDKKSEAPIKDQQDILLFLKYLHLTGNILYIEDDILCPIVRKCEDVKVIIDPQWVVHAFRRLITAPKFAVSRHGAENMNWMFYQKSKELTLALVRQFWSLDEDKHLKFCDYITDLLKFMEMSGLIARPVSGTTQSERKNSDYYIVPSLLGEATEEEIEKLFQGHYVVKTRTLSIKFGVQYIPFPVFHKLLAVCIDRFKRFRGEKSHMLKKDFGCFTVSPNWNLCIYCKKSTIKLTMFKLDPSNAIKAGIGKEVKSFIENTMKDILRIYGHQQVQISHYLDSSPYVLEHLRSVEDIIKSGDEPVSCGPDNALVFLNKADLKPWICGDEEKGQEIVVPDFFPFMHEQPTDNQLSRISAKIPIVNDYLRFFEALGLEHVAVEHIMVDFNQEDFPSKVYRLFKKWKEVKHKEATYRCIIAALKILNKKTDFLKNCR